MAEKENTKNDAQSEETNTQEQTNESTDQSTTNTEVSQVSTDTVEQPEEGEQDTTQEPATSLENNPIEEEETNKEEEKESKEPQTTNKKRTKVLGYSAAYIGKGKKLQVIQGSFKRKKDAERKLRHKGVKEDNMIITSIKG